MQISLTFEKEFDELLERLHQKYPQELFDMDGIGRQLDAPRFSEQFLASKVTADASIDANANVDDTSVIVHNTEVPKPLYKLNSYYVLWKELKRQFGLEVANQIIEMQINGAIYIHDVWGLGQGMSYCFNYSTYDIMTKGLPMIKKIRSLPPKYLCAFKSQVEQFLIIASNSTLGATGLADLLIVMSYYVRNILESGHDAGFYFDGWFSEEEKKLIEDDLAQIPVSTPDGSRDELINQMTKHINEKLGKTRPHNEKWFRANVEKYIRENLVSLIYTLNQPLRGNQSSFTNLSLYDRPFLESLQEDYIFPDGRTFDIELVQKLQEIYIDAMNVEKERTAITFPVKLLAA